MDSTSTNNNQEVWLVDTDLSNDDEYALRYFLLRKKVVAITLNTTNCAKPLLLKKSVEDSLEFKYKSPETKVFLGADRAYINYQTELKDDEIFDAYSHKNYDIIFKAYAEKEEQLKEDFSSQDVSTKIGNTAAVKIAEYVKLYGKNLNILSLGPLTNLSLAVLLDSTIKDSFGKLYIAGGSYNNLGNSGNCAEYNFRVDPVAAKNVVNYYKNITMITLEVEDEIIKSHPFADFTFEISKFNAELPALYNQEEDEETRMRSSFLGFIAAILAANPDFITATNTKPSDVDIIGRYTRGALAIEKYDYLRSGKFNEVTYIETIDLEKMKGVLQDFVINC